MGLPPPIHLLPSGGAYSSVAQREFGYAGNQKVTLVCRIGTIVPDRILCFPHHVGSYCAKKALPFTLLVPDDTNHRSHESHESRPVQRSGTNGDERFVSSN